MNKIDNKITIAIMLINVYSGGTLRHTKEIIDYWQKNGYKIIFLHIMDRIVKVSVYEKDKKEKVYYIYKKINILIDVLKYYQVKFIHIEHIRDSRIEYLKLYKILGIPFVITLHDYYTVCPFIQLTYENHNYCEEKGENDCQSCLARRNFYSLTLNKKIIDINEWRNWWHRYLKEAAIVMVPSFDAKKRIQSYFPDLNIVVRENPEMVSYRSTNRQIGLIGELSAIKGARKIKDCLAYCVEHQIPIHFILFGTLLDVQLTDKEKDYITILGPYQENNVYNQISSRFIDFFWFPVVCPETYSYTLSIPVRLKIPCLGTNLGAVSSRIIQHHWGETYPWNLNTKEVIKKLLDFKYEDFYNKNFIITNTSFGEFEEYYDNLTCCKINKNNKNQVPAEMPDIPYVFDEIHEKLTNREFLILWASASKKEKVVLLRYIDIDWLQKVFRAKGWKYFLKKIKEKF